MTIANMASQEVPSVGKEQSNGRRTLERTITEVDVISQQVQPVVNEQPNSRRTLERTMAAIDVVSQQVQPVAKEQLTRRRTLERTMAAVDVYAKKLEAVMFDEPDTVESLFESGSVGQIPRVSQLSVSLRSSSTPVNGSPPEKLSRSPPASSPHPGFTFNATDLTLCSGVSPPPLLPVNPKHLEQVLTTGTRMIKYPSKASSRPAERVIRVDLQSLQIFWESKKKKSHLSAGNGWVRLFIHSKWQFD